MIDAGEAKVLEGAGAKSLNEAVARRLDVELATRDCLEELLQLLV